MSVRKGERSQGRLQVLNKAKELKMYSLALIRNEKCFPKSTRWIYAGPIVEEIRKAYSHIVRANAVYVTNEDEFRFRHMEQIKAHSSLDVLLSLVQDVYEAHYLSGKQVNYWTGLIVETDNLLKAWIKADKERF